ncbi:MAG: hypothetical protein ACREXK_05065 [Gammaproteobacteria bacterium]
MDTTVFVGLYIVAMMVLMGWCFTLMFRPMSDEPKPKKPKADDSKSDEPEAKT